MSHQKNNTQQCPVPTVLIDEKDEQIRNQERSYNDMADTIEDAWAAFADVKVKVEKFRVDWTKALTKINELNDCVANTQQAYDGGCIDRDEYDARTKAFLDHAEAINDVLETFQSPDVYKGKECMCKGNRVSPETFINCIDEVFNIAYAFMEWANGKLDEARNKFTEADNMVQENRDHNTNPSSQPNYECYTIGDITTKLGEITGVISEILQEVQNMQNQNLGVSDGTLDDAISEANEMMDDLINDLKIEVDKDNGQDAQGGPYTCDLETDCYGNDPAPQFNLKKLMNIIINN